MKKRIFLTGINGYLGSHIAFRLARDGHHVIGLVRGMVDAPLLKGCRFDICRGDILDPQTYAKALHECDAVMHTAAVTAFGLRNKNEYYAVNWKGTALLLESASRNGIKRFIHAGTRGTFGAAEIPERSDETLPARDILKGEDYLRSKYLAEQEVRKYAGNGAMECLILSPTALAGGCDHKPSPAGRIFSSFLRGRIHWYVDGGINIVDVEDAAGAFINALERGDPGQTYFLGNSNITLREIFRILSCCGSGPRRLVKVPVPLACAAARGMEWMARLSGRPAFATPHKVRSLYHNHAYCSSQKAVRDLALAQTPVKTTLERAAAWFLRQT